MFTQKCFIRKNSKELQDEVYRLGGRRGTCLWESEFRTLLAVRHDSFRCYDDEWGNTESLIEGCYIDCGTNEQLFLALAALRDDSDVNQWFVNENKSCWWKCSLDSFKQDFEESNEDMDWSYKHFHKATPQELIEHFKDR